MLGRDENTPWNPEYVAVFLTSLSHGGSVDDRHHLLDVVHDHPVKEMLAPALQRHQLNISFQVIRLPVEIFKDAHRLFFLCVDHGRQQSAQSQDFSLIIRKSGSFVKNRIVKHVKASWIPEGFVNLRLELHLSITH